MPFQGVGDSAVRVDVHDSNMPGMSESDTTAIKGGSHLHGRSALHEGSKKATKRPFPRGITAAQEH
jgi:hypothetical protein